MKISFPEVLKVLELLSSRDATNHQLATLMLESFGVLEDFQDDCIAYLAHIPLAQKQSAHFKLEEILRRTFAQRSVNSIPAYRALNLKTINPEKAATFLALSFRHTGESSREILQRNDLPMSLKLVNFCLEVFRKKGNGLKYLPLEKVRSHIEIEDWINGDLGKFHLNYELNQAMETLNVLDFSLESLEKIMLEKLAGKTLRMRYGYFIRHQKLLQKYPKVKIQIDETDHFREGIQYYRYENKMSWLAWLDRGIFAKKHLTAVARTPMRCFPNELALYPNLQIIYFPESTLRVLPYRILRCKSLEYLVISTCQEKIKVKAELATHPNLKGVFFQHKIQQDGVIKNRALFYLSLDEMLAFEAGIIDLTQNPFSRSLNAAQRQIFSEAEAAAAKFYQYKVYKNNTLQNFFSDYPLPIFEDVTFEPSLISDTNMEKLLTHLNED